jgi:hypothetical protein
MNPRREYHQKWYIENKERLSKHYRGKYYEERHKFFEMYGEVCACCGESTIEFLTVEHIQGQIGRTHRKFGNKAYKEAIREYRPDLYEVLCMNCNHARGRYGYCPHRKDKKTLYKPATVSTYYAEQ